MNEQEMREELDRLRREPELANQSRERLREIVCTVWPVDPADVIEKEIVEG